MIMKKNVLLYMAAVAGLVLAGCNKGPAAPEVPGEIRVKASIGELTKVSYDGEKSAFAAKDTISVYAWMDSAAEVPAKKVVDGVVNTFDGQVWNPRVQMLWKTVVDPHYFLGIAPARYVKDFKADPFEQDPQDYAASDLLIATNLKGVKASDGLVSLAFDHVMAKLQVNLNFRSQWNEQWGALPAQKDVKVQVKAKTVGTVDYLAKEITASAQAQAVDLPITALAAPAKDYTYSYSNLIIPQGGVMQITVIVGETAFVYNHANEKGISLEKGKVTTIGLKVGREQMDLETISVDDWTEGAMPATDGEAEEEESGDVDLGKLTADYVAKDGVTLTGTLNGGSQPYTIFIADGATVTLDNAIIMGVNSNKCPWAGITCEGDATIILKEGSENFVKGFKGSYPSIYVPVDKTLTINGDGSLEAHSNGDAAGIGGGSNGINCGNIDIQGGNITAYGGYYAACIGSGGVSMNNPTATRCGNISISGGTVTTASNGEVGTSFAAGIGCGRWASCGDITISGGTVVAIGGNYSAAIGSGNGYMQQESHRSLCGNIVISGGTVTAYGGIYASAIGCGSNADCGDITISTEVDGVMATKGSQAPYSIGAGYGADKADSICGDVRVCGVSYLGGVDASPFTYPAP